MNKSDMTRYWHTIRYLKFSQVLWRIWFYFYRPAIPPAGALEQAALTGWIEPCQKRSSLCDRTTLDFLGEKGDIDTVGWRGPARSSLWRYNQHYFDDLAAGDAGDRRAWHRELLARWMDENRPGSAPGWEPYPLSLRVVNWIKWDCRCRAEGADGLTMTMQGSLAAQLGWLLKHVEYHLLANHVIANAKALLFGGCYFRGPDADAWFETGADILRRELPEQVLADGGHFERSPMYHAIVLEDLLDVLNVVRASGDRKSARALTTLLEDTIPGMMDWLQAMTLPDGEISFFNDAAMDIAPRLESLEQYAGRLGIVRTGSGAVDGINHLADSGYIRLDGDDMCAVLDVAPVGPDYNPGHAHADTLAFELYLSGYRLLVNGGTSTYEPGERRAVERGTKAHNTVAVMGEDSSEVWKSFRVARRASPFDLVLERGAEVRIGCSHDGYMRLRGGPVHRRTWTFQAGELLVLDEVSPQSGATAYFHLHPDVQGDLQEQQVRLTLPNGGRVTMDIEAGQPELCKDLWSPRFGVTMESRVVTVRLVDGISRVKFNW